MSEWIDVAIKPESDGEYLVCGWFNDGGSLPERRIAEFRDCNWLRPVDEFSEEDDDGNPSQEGFSSHEIKKWTRLPEIPKL